MATTQLRFKGGVPQQTLYASLNAGATSLQIVDGTGWPTNFPYEIIIDNAVSSKRERVKVGGSSGTAPMTLNTLTRGQDGTTDVDHAVGATVQVSVPGTWFDEVGQLLGSATTNGDIIYYDGSKYQRVAVGGTAALLRVAGGVPTWAAGTKGDIPISNGTGFASHAVPANGSLLYADSAQADGWNNLAASGLTGASTWTPTLAQGATNNITKTVNVNSYIQIGKLTIFWVKVTSTGAGTANNAITLSLPVTAVSSGHTMPGGGFVICTAQVTGISYLATTTTCALLDTTITGGAQIGATGSSSAVALANGHVVYMSGAYMAA